MAGPLGNNVPSGHQREGQYASDTSVPNLHFFCVLILRDIIDKIGGLDERYAVGCWDDMDYGSRARFAGYGLYASARALVRHEPHQVFRLNGLDADRYDHENLFRFTNKLHQIVWALSRERNLYADEASAEGFGLRIPL
jgi:GT2 family glycosyltransferase